MHSGGWSVSVVNSKLESIIFCFFLLLFFQGRYAHILPPAILCSCFLGFPCGEALPADRLSLAGAARTVETSEALCLASAYRAAGLLSLLESLGFQVEGSGSWG